jgi:hypothetical protein
MTSTIRELIGQQPPTLGCLFLQPNQHVRGVLGRMMVALAPSTELKSLITKEYGVGATE